MLKQPERLPGLAYGDRKPAFMYNVIIEALAAVIAACRLRRWLMLHSSCQLSCCRLQGISCCTWLAPWTVTAASARHPWQLQAAGLLPHTEDPPSSDADCPCCPRLPPWLLQAAGRKGD